MSSRKIIKKVRRPEKLVEIVEMKSKKRAQRQPKKQGRQRNRVRAPQNRRGIQRQPQFDFFPRGNRQGTGFGRRKSIVIKESEFISEYVVANQPNFNVALALPINPGQAGTFPWLSLIAKQYEKYCFRSLRFIYKPEVTQFNPTSSAQGKVMLSCDYDSADAPPTSKKQVEDTDPHCDGMPYELISFYLDPRELHKNSDAKFIRPGNLPGQGSILDYDAGLLFVSNQGQTANGVNLGELHVEYEVELSVPILEPTASAPANNSVSQFIDTTVWTTATPTVMTFATAASAGGKGPYITANGVNCVNTGGLIVPPSGNYLVMVNVIANDATTDELTQVALSVNLNAITLSQLASNNQYTMWYLGSVQQGVSLSYQGFIQCNGTDYLSVSGICDFSAGALTTVSTLSLIAI